MEDEKLAESRCPESGGEMESRNNNIAMVIALKDDIERVGEE